MTPSPDEWAQRLAWLILNEWPNLNMECDIDIFHTQLAAALIRVRNEALEEAALKADSWNGFNAQCHTIAGSIRALKDKHDHNKR